MDHYKSPFLHTLQDVFSIRPFYMDIYFSCTPQHNRGISGHLHISQKLKQTNTHVNLWKNRSTDCAIRGVIRRTLWLTQCLFYEIRGRYHCLFKQGFSPQYRVMEYKEQQYLRLFLPELKRHTKKVLIDNIQPLQLVNKQTCFITPQATRASRATCRMLERGSDRSYNSNVSCTYFVYFRIYICYIHRICVMCSKRWGFALGHCFLYHCFP